MSKLSHKKKAVTPPATLKLREKVFFIGFALLFFGLPSFFLHRRSIHDQTASISKTVQKWKHIYHIDDEKAELIQQIELDFHGNGSPFSIKPARTKEEKHRHHQEISSLMAPEDGARFMKAMEKSDDRH
ncbi:hypothetical protein [Prosthecobacter dejongeii]|uniref:MFS superfamily sulfate permease-like transporter n=1 Tax=Prosthecobacter dejongeii TaxID=48465 RepID=A0A7W7YHS4_9BACT|nr:hypothetical protein [Prosthecobacter dejongeii]MBB5036359.1 MFS superfamily sulfate permease-like transporter [Prosthecobacter dejongeii]